MSHDLGDEPGQNKRDAGGTAAEIDPVTLEVIRNACVAVAEEMNATLVRTGYSPNIKERRDCSTALFDAEGEMIAQAETMPVHLGAMPFSVAAAIERFPPETLAPGDTILLNDPFHGGAHLPDLTLVTPIFRGAGNDGDSDGGDSGNGDSDGDSSSGDSDGDSSSGDSDGRRDGDSENGGIVAYAANRAHHADIGGSTAGSVAADSTEIFEEGLRIPPVKLRRGGETDDGILAILLVNVRTPEERRGDLHAQEAANQTGRRRFEQLVARHGETLPRALDAIKDYSERRMRAEISEIPDGTYEFGDVLDDDGRGNHDIQIRAAITIEGDSITVDFSGSADRTEGPVNAVFAVTASATYYAIRCVTDPDIPPNHGCYRPVEIHAPEDSIVNAEPPAAVVGGNLEASQRITDVVLGALAKAVPDRVVAAGQGTMNNVTFGGTDPRDVSASGASGGSPDASGGDSPYAFYETQGGGFGARADADGMDGVHVHMSNTRNTPIEVLETAYPLRVRRYQLRTDSGGAGEFRGGLGLRRDIEVRDHTARVSLLADRQHHAPYGLFGGESGQPGASCLLDEDTETGDDATSKPLPGKSVHDLDSGSVVSLRTPGGGGYGDPQARDRDEIERDLRLGKLSAELAREAYGYAPESDDGREPDGE